MMRRSLHNRPLRSVLANRKLFQGGGMVGMGNPMANMQPMGILASSQPLVDAVANDAINPQGGPTLSMADGGIAKFDNGGYVYDPVPFSTRYPGQHGTWPEDLYPAMGEGLRRAADSYEGAEEDMVLGEAPEALMPTQAERGAILAQDPEVGISQAAEPELLSEQLLAEEEIEAAVAPAAFATEEGVGIEGEVSKESVLKEGVYYDPEGIAVFPQTLDQVPENLFYDYDDESFHQPTPDLLSKDEAPSEGKAAVAEAGEAINMAFDATAEADAELEARRQDPFAYEEETVVHPDVAAAEAITPQTARGKTPITTDYKTAAIFDIEAAAKEFEGRMPEYDSDTTGMNLLLLGAAIMEGESEHWAVNVGAGMRKVLPQFIKDKKDRESFMRSTKMAGTKYALGKRDAFEADQRATERAKNNYWIDNEITFTDAEGNVVEKFTKGFSRLNDRQVEAIQQQEGITLIPEETYWRKYTADAAVREARLAALDEKIRTHDEDIKAYPVMLGEEQIDLKVNYVDPYYLQRNPNLNPIIQNRKALINAYETGQSKIDEFEFLANNVDMLLAQASVGEARGVTGLDNWIGQAEDIFHAFMPGGEAKEVFGIKVGQYGNDNIWNGVEGQLSTANAYNTVLRILAIQMAPILLGESGKTISDGDRRLIADALGITKTTDGAWQFTGGSLKNPAELQLKINLLKERLSKARLNMDNQYKNIWEEFGVATKYETMYAEEIEQFQQEPPEKRLKKQGEVYVLGV